MTLQRYDTPDERDDRLTPDCDGEYVKRDDVLELIFEILTAVSSQGNDTVSDDYILGRTDAEGAILCFLEEENGGTY